MRKSSKVSSPRTGSFQRVLLVVLTLSSIILIGLLYSGASQENVSFMAPIPSRIEGHASMVNNNSSKTKQTDVHHLKVQSRHQKTMIPASHKAGKASKVLVVAYFRSGSTYFSEMFNLNLQAFYMFEPLVYYLLSANRTLAMQNGKNSTVERMEKNSYIISLLDDILNCRLQSLSVWYLHHPFLTKSQRFLRYLQCIHTGGRRTRYPMSYCVKLLIQMCKSSPLRVVKLIRFGITVKTVTELIKRNPDLKIVHLVRDPRGSVLSQFDADRPKTAYDAFKRITGYCDKIEKDLLAIQTLKNISDIEILTVNYEDMAENPTSAISAVYSFLGWQVPGRVIVGIKNRSSAKRHDDKFGTIRENSTETAYAWKLKIKYDIVKTIDSYCSTWYHHLGYLPINSKKELLDLNNKHRVPLLRGVRVT